MVEMRLHPPSPFYRGEIKTMMCLQNVRQNFTQTCICHHSCENFSNLWCSDYWKIHLRIKTLNEDISTHASQIKFSPSSYHTIRQRKLRCSSLVRAPFCGASLINSSDTMALLGFQAGTSSN